MYEDFSLWCNKFHGTGVRDELSTSKSTSMLKSYWKSALRNLWKDKGFSAINIIGLAIGLATCLLIILYVTDEWSFDSYNLKAGRIYRIDNQMKFGDNQFDAAQAGPVMGPVFARDFPEVEQWVRFRHRGGFSIRKGNEHVKEEKVIYADSSLFDVFTLPFISGDPGSALKEPHSLVITEGTARKYFNRTDVVGQSLLIDDQTNYKITGVIKDVPAQSHFNYDFFAAMSELDDSRADLWMSQNFNTYIVLKPGVDAKSLEKRFNAALEKYAEPEFKSAVNLSMADLEKGGGYFHCSLMPLTKIHLYSNKPGELSANGNIQYVYIFSAIALFILLIACINFMNLSTARSANRAKEVGVRKVLGSERKNLIAQFLTESLLISALALIVALLLLWLLIPYFNHLSQKDTAIGIFFKPRSLFFMLSLVFVVGLLAGCYPAFYLSAFKPIDVLKGRLAKGFKGSLLRNGLVVFQFAVSIILIAGTLIVYSQLRYIHNKDIGFNKEQVLVIQHTDVLKEQLAPFRNALFRLPGVQNVTVTGFLPVDGYRSNDVFFNDASLDIKRSVSMQKWGVDANYIPTLQIKIVRGRNFSSQLASDSNAFIINEAAEKYLDPGDPLNKKLYELDDLQTKKISAWHVIGVMRDFNFNSLHDQVSPLALSLRQESASIALRVNMGNIGTLLTQLKDEWKKMVPSQPFSYAFLDQEFNSQYLAEQRVGSISISFSVLAILVACLGLFGLVTFAAEQRVKEIGIRKVLGANIPDIVGLLSMDLLKLVVLAILIASPVAYWIMDRWLRDFAYRTGINWAVFVLAGSAGLFIAFSTIGYHAIKAARANPVKALRSE